MRRSHQPLWVERGLDAFNQAWARHFLHPQFESIGAESRFQGPFFVHIQGPNVRVGDHLHMFAAPQAPVSISVDPYDGGAGRVDIGSYCVLSPGLRIRSAIGVRIGDNCMLAEGIYITDADWHDAYHRVFPGKRAAVEIGDNVWIGDRATICKGVTIGDHSIVGACAVVTRDVPPYTIVAGNPAREVGTLDADADFSMREHLFLGGHYERFKREYDEARLAGNTISGWLRALLFPTRRS